LITKEFKQRLGDISLEDIKKEGLGPMEEFKEEWENDYGVWTPDLIVIAYESNLSKRRTK
jgi:hypothetical protein